MGRRRRRPGLLPLLLLCWALLGLLQLPAVPGQSVRHTYENVKLLQISVRPPAPLQILANEEGSLKDQEYAKSAEEAESEEKNLNDLVGVLQDMVKEIPTVETPVYLQTIPIAAIPQPTEPPVVTAANPEPTHSEAIDTTWDTLRPTLGEEHVEISETVAVTKEITSASPTAGTVLELQNGTSESIVLLTDRTTTEKPLISLSVFIEKATTRKRIKNFDQLTNGALSNLVQSLEKVKKLNGILDTFTKKTVAQENEVEKGHKKRPTTDDILDLIEELIKTIKSTPAFVKEDSNLYKNIQIAESYIRQALELTTEAEKKVQQENQLLPSTPLPAEETKFSLAPMPTLPAPIMTVPETSPPLVPLAQKTEDTQIEMGKLKAFVNLLYGFTPQLVTYSQNSARKKVAEDIVERAFAVLDAIKSVFCGKEEAQSKKVLKQLLKEDMELVNQAMKARRVA